MLIIISFEVLVGNAPGHSGVSWLGSKGEDQPGVSTREDETKDSPRIASELCCKEAIVASQFAGPETRKLECGLTEVGAGSCDVVDRLANLEEKEESHEFTRNRRTRPVSVQVCSWLCLSGNSGSLFFLATRIPCS